MIEIRLAKEDDLGALLNIDSVVRAESSRKEEIAGWIKKEECFVAEKNGKIVGYAALNYTFFRRGFVDMLMVGEEYRGQRIGESLLRYLSGVCRTDTLWTSTNFSNKPMQKLLERMGFKITGIIDNLDEGDPEMVFYIKTSKLSEDK